MLLWIMHSIHAIFSLIIPKYFIEIFSFFTVTSRTLIKYHHPPPSFTITENHEKCVEPPTPRGDVIIELPLYFFSIKVIFDLVLNLRIQSEYRKIRTRNNSVFGPFSRSVIVHYYCYCLKRHGSHQVVHY